MDIKTLFRVFISKSDHLSDWSDSLLLASSSYLL